MDEAKELPQQQRHNLFRHFQPQQQAAMARFPSNIDAHLRPLGAIRPFLISPNPNPSSNPNPNPSPNPISTSIHPPNPNLAAVPHLQPKVIRTPSQPPPPPIDVWRHQSDVKRPFDASERDKVTSDAFFSVRDRKVRIPDKDDLYALCRSWLRNGYREEIQTQYGDMLKSLPKPLHLPESSSPEKKLDDETDGEDENAIGTSCAEELLQRHIKRAKKVRERLREERLRRIKRYKSRLKLLLPPPLEQCRGDIGPP